MTKQPPKPGSDQSDSAISTPKDGPAAKAGQKPAPETGGPKGPEPTRYGDWELNGKCVDF